MYRKMVLYVFSMLISANIVYADCSYNGTLYPEGTIIGPYMCSNGQWIRR